jgi:DNA polymerase-3 subunit chi
MPTTIDFYLLTYPNMDASSIYICRLSEKAYKTHHQVYIYTASDEEARKLNELLWTFRDISFVPHSIDKPAPIQIGSTKPPTSQNDILINLTPEAPAFYADFNRILEIIPNNTTLKAAGRKKYKYYQEHSCKLKTHNIT